MLKYIEYTVEDQCNVLEFNAGSVRTLNLRLQ
jgi:hypothetical protein